MLYYLSNSIINTIHRWLIAVLVMTVPNKNSFGDYSVFISLDLDLTEVFDESYNGGQV